MEFTIEAGELLDLDRSSLTISLNDQTVGSFRVSLVDKTTQRIFLPVKLFHQGNNTLTFNGMLSLPDDQQTNCQNWDDPSRALIIEPGSIIHLSFAKHDMPVDLSNFPRAFIEPLEQYTGNTAHTLFVLPDDSTLDDLNSLTATAYFLGGKAGSDYDWMPEIVSGSQFNPEMASNRNIVFIGNAPVELKEIASADRDFLAMTSSPWGSGNAILIIGDRDREDGFSPAMVFGDPDRSALPGENVAYPDPSNLPESPLFQGSISFEALGYPDRTVSGIGEQDLTYRLFIPYNVDPKTAGVNLILSHSPELNAEASSFQVYLNGFSLTSLPINTDSPEADSIKVNLPSAKFHPGGNLIRIAFDLHSSHISCELAPESVQVTILNSTNIEITHRNTRPLSSLKYFPMPFSDYLGTTFVIPEDYSLDGLRHIAKLSFTMGQAAYPASNPPEVITGKDFDPAAVNQSNLIMVGLPEQNPAIMLVNDLLPQPFTKSGNSLQEGFGVYLPATDNVTSLGLMQVIPSPWADDGTILVLTGSDAQGPEWVWAVLEDPALREQFTGNIMVVGAKEQSSTLRSTGESLQVNFQQTAEVSNIPVLGPILQKTGRLAPAPALIALGVGLVLVLSAFFITQMVIKRNKVKRDSTSDE